MLISCLFVCLPLPPPTIDCFMHAEAYDAARFARLCDMVVSHLEQSGAVTRTHVEAFAQVSLTHLVQLSATRAPALVVTSLKQRTQPSHTC